MSLLYQTPQHWADALAHFKSISGMDIAPDGTAINPVTGQRQLVYARTPNDALTEDYSDFRFDNPGFGYGSLAGMAPGYYGGGGFLDGLGGLGDLALGTAGFGVGGVSGASAATGGGVTPQTLALDAAGLAAGYGLAGMGLGAPTAAAGGTTAGGGGAAAAGGGEAVLGSGITQGAGGVTGITPGAAGISGISPAYASGSLAPGFFASEAAYPVLGGATAAGTGAAAAPSGGAPAASAAVPTAASSLPSVLSSAPVIGALGGALLGSGVLGGGSEAGTVETEEGLPDWLLPYAKPALDRYTNELQNYQTDPYGIMPSAMKEFQNTISGMYLDPSTNKYLEDYFRLGSERIRTNLSPSFGHMQAFGQHSGYNEALSRGLGDFATGLYGGAYAKERDRQTTMTASAPTFLTQSSTASFAPYQQYLSTIGNLGRKKEQPYFDNPMGNIIGGGMFGYGLGNAFK